MSAGRTSAARAPVLVVGDLMVDVVAVAAEPVRRGTDTRASVALRGGGAGANVAAWLAGAGVPVTLAARAGDDAAGRAAVAELAAAGVDARVALDPEAATGTCVVLVEPGGERTMLPDRAANLALSPADLPAAAFAPGAHLHLSGYVLLDAGCRPAGLAALERARAAGMSISVDPASAAPLLACGPERVLEWLDRIDVLLPNADEALALTGERDPERAAVALAARAGEVVVTLGAQGALWSDGERVRRVPAAAARAAPVDTTGAGDAFAAGWIAAVRDGCAPERALRRATALAARAVARPGARPAAAPARQG
jgi:sugar/nucleoside kinase (ribokinase family)